MGSTIFVELVLTLIFEYLFAIGLKNVPSFLPYHINILSNKKLSHRLKIHISTSNNYAFIFIE